MLHCVALIFSEAPPYMNVKSTTVKFDETTDRGFHHFVLNYFLLCRRKRLDLQMDVTFLRTRVKSLDRYHYNNMNSMVKNIRCTKDLLLNLEAD